MHGVALVIQDLSYQKKLEDEARRNETLARLGGLVAGLAHEVKNPLGGIKGAAQLLAKRFADQPQIGEYTGVMIREIDRLSRLVEQLLTLGAPATADARAAQRAQDHPRGARVDGHRARRQAHHACAWRSIPACRMCAARRRS